MSYPSNDNMENRGIQPYVDLSIAVGGGSNETDITVQFKDSDENDVDDVFFFDFWMADNADGSAIASDATSAHGDGGSGNLVGTLQSTAHATFMTDANGECVVTVTDSGKVTNYACVKDPRTGLTNVSRILAAADYT